jgi:hypothetical protein
MRARTGKWLAWGAAALALAAVFALYTRPQFMVGVADLVWACFQ